MTNFYYNLVTFEYLQILKLIIFMHISYMYSSFVVVSFLYSFLPESSLSQIAYDEHEFHCYIRNPGTILLYSLALYLNYMFMYHDQVYCLYRVGLTKASNK